jgi:antitoxin component of MazEF toxin-antitoxin module
MGRRSLEERNIRNLLKVARGNSYGITIPIDMVRKLKWRAGQKVEVKLSKNQLVVRDWKPKKAGR